MKEAHRRVALAVALVGTLVAVWFAPEPEEEIASAVQPTPREAKARQAPTAAVEAQSSQAARTLRDDVPSIFEVTSWSKPVAKAAAPKIAPVIAEAELPPQAPAAPFRILGRFVEDGVTGLFVQYNDRTLVARAGDLIGDVYKVASIADQSMTVVYLPMNLTQTITTGAAN